MISLQERQESLGPIGPHQAPEQKKTQSTREKSMVNIAGVQAFKMDGGNKERRKELTYSLVRSVASNMWESQAES